MNLYVDNKTQIGNIQKQFNALYPFLKLEFFVKQKDKNVFLKSEVYTSDGGIKNILTNDTKTIIDVNLKRTVAEVEVDLRMQFGLLAQVFRLCGNVWVETTLTDDWTLEKQNLEGEQISSHFTVTPLKNNLSIIDYLAGQKEEKKNKGNEQ